MAKVVKAPLPQVGTSVHKQKALPDDLVRFSFRHYTPSAKFCLPIQDKAIPYLEVFLERLKDVSGIRLSEFRANKSKTLRSHSHDWEATTEKNGYSHLTSQLRECTPWQFSLTANEHGRIHGILIDDIFYVVWIDPNHSLYE